MKRILVVGDIILDLYTWCRFKKMCPDRPGVPAYVKGGIDRYPGGAANVAVNLAELVGSDGVVHLIGAASRDTLRLIKYLSKGQLEMSDCVETEGDMSKDRIVLPDLSIAMRLDSRDKWGTSIDVELVRRIGEVLASTHFDAVVVSDYGSGLFPETFKLTSQHNRCFVDTKEKNLLKLGDAFGGPFVLKLNDEEYNSIGMIQDRPPEFYAQNTIVTHGADGASLLVGHPIGKTTYSTQRISFKGYEPEAVVDVSGCGDTFLSAVVFWSTCILDGDVAGAIDFANACAASVVDRFGTTCVRYNDVEYKIPEEKRRLG